MTTPERPSLADTLARIDAVLDAYYDPTTNTREVDVVARITHIVDHAAKPPVVRDGNTFTVTQPGVYQVGGSVHPYGKPAPPHLPGPPGPTCPGCAARDARPGWLARTLNRLFGGAS